MDNAAGDDVQVIQVNKGQPIQTCITAGTNTKRDTNTSGDDGVSGENIHTGADGICNTTADNTDDMSTDPYTAAVLQNFLNSTVYNQAVVNWSEVVKLSDMTVNFDLNRDGDIDVSSWTTAEMDVVINQCKDDDYEYNIFLVDNPNDGSTGFMNTGQMYGFIHADNATWDTQTTAHELGHGAFSLPHTRFDTVNLMHVTEGVSKTRLRKYQWDLIQ
ncbi:MAG: hypothetical protein IIC00_16495 [Planctomycetes bacterium]|nr:hypothetical protein [Planctomycetota bacterium]